MYSWKSFRYSIFEKISGTVSSKRYTWKDSRYSTPEKNSGTVSSKRSQDKELIYIHHKISFHKATSPQYYKRVRHMLTKIPILRRSYMMHINSLSTNPHARSTIRELNSSWKDSRYSLLDSLKHTTLSTLRQAYTAHILMSHNQAHSSTFRTSTRLVTRTHSNLDAPRNAYTLPHMTNCLIVMNNLCRCFAFDWLKAYSWKNSRYSTPEKIPSGQRQEKKKSNGTLCASATHTPLLNRSAHSLRVHTRQGELIYDHHKISFHKATSPQYNKRVHHVLT
jgi:hypothetical protein